MLERRRVCGKPAIVISRASSSLQKEAAGSYLNTSIKGSRTKGSTKGAAADLTSCRKRTTK